MSKTTLIGLILLLLLLFTSFEARSRNPATGNTQDNQVQPARPGLLPAVALAKAVTKAGAGRFKR